MPSSPSPWPEFWCIVLVVTTGMAVVAAYLVGSR